MLQIKNTLGGGKPEGMYVWKKYEYTNGIYLTNPKITSAYISSTTKELTGSNFNLSDVFEALGISAGTYSYTTNEYKALAKFLDGMNDGTFGLVNGWYGYENYLCYVFDITSTNAGFRNIASIQVNSNNVTISHNNADNTSGTSNKYFTYTGEKVVIEQGKCDFIDYIVSDKETAYPDGGEKGGYWYEKVVEGAKVAYGTASLSSYNSLTINHGLGVVPTKIFLVGKNGSTNVVYGCSYSENIKIGGFLSTSYSTNGIFNSITDTLFEFSASNSVSISSVYWIAVAE